MKPSLEKRLAQRHRPKDRQPVMYQKWRDLLFLHWKVRPEKIQASLPKGLWVDTFENDAYVGLVPFFMKAVRPRFFPALPMLSNFLEMNVRTYVYDQKGNPGVWFYSLDANQWLAVKLARAFFYLPYFKAKMKAQKTRQIFYEVQRQNLSGIAPSKFEYEKLEEMPSPSPRSLEFFLIERYLLFAMNPRNGLIYSGQVHHPPYPLQRVKVTLYQESALSLAGFEIVDRPPDHQVMSCGVDVDIFSITKNDE